MSAMPDDSLLKENYAEYQEHLEYIRRTAGLTRVPAFMSVTFAEWRSWANANKAERGFESVKLYANYLFVSRAEELFQGAKELTDQTLVPRRYVLVLTEEIGQDKANDVSYILIIKNDCRRLKIFRWLNMPDYFMSTHYRSGAQ